MRPNGRGLRPLGVAPSFPRRGPNDQERQGSATELTFQTTGIQKKEREQMTQQPTVAPTLIRRVGEGRRLPPIGPELFRILDMDF